MMLYIMFDVFLHRWHYLFCKELIGYFVYPDVSIMVNPFTNFHL